MLAAQRFALDEHSLDRIDIDRAAEQLDVCALVLATDVTNEDVRQLGSFAGANGEVNRDNINADILQQYLDEVVIQFLLAQAETDGVDTFVQYLQCFGISLAGVLASADVLTDIPLVVGTCTADVWELSGCGSRCLQTFEVFTTVERLYVEAFRGAPYELLVEVGALQVSDDLVLPSLCGDRCKIR